MNERLTYYCDEKVGAANKKGINCFKQVLEKLAAYEDTDLIPAEVAEQSEELAEYRALISLENLEAVLMDYATLADRIVNAEENNTHYRARLAAYKQAEEEGRVLPDCKKYDNRGNPACCADCRTDEYIENSQELNDWFEPAEAAQAAKEDEG